VKYALFRVHVNTFDCVDARALHDFDARGGSSSLLEVPFAVWMPLAGARALQ
jgi:hypothetical protein